ncbi:uncharacterized protein LOC129354048 [Poeciliopsis prolifica]|uniref:uncharacterized protein LOC129354048 n=1 Tax=Poeciliopsis prolifica TaxID=188132 RepID=UPI0024142FAB|nr:uncharacterized protein LOC129354048 [Poeciliopsis prolifica]
MDFWTVLLLFAAAAAPAAAEAAAAAPAAPAAAPEAAAAAPAAAEAAAAAPAAAEAAAVNLTRKVGDNVTLSLEHKPLKPGDTVIWSNGPETGEENVLFYIFDIGNHDGPTQKDRFDLDLTTGALTIKRLSATDSAVYYGQIINGNGTKRFFKLTVEGPDPIQPTDEPQQHPNTRIIISAVVAVVVLIFLFIAFVVKKKKPCRKSSVV